jgi:raffinose/stachyose/melibiose transport system permease protein
MKKTIRTGLQNNMSTSKKRILYLFVVPAFVIYLTFWIMPVIMSYYYGLTDWTGIGDYQFVGFQNLKILWNDGTLVKTLKNTVIYAVYAVVWGNLQALALALILNVNLKMKGFFRTIFYIPALFSTIVIGFIWSYVYAPQYGMIHELFSLIGMGEQAPNLLGKASTALIAVAFVERWKTTGTMTIIYLAGLQDIPEEVIESARMDGCRGWQLIRYVKIPMLANTITINTMLGLISGFKAFDYIFTLTHGGPGSSTSTLMYAVYKMAFIENQYGVAEALAAVAFLLILTVSVVTLTLMKKKEIEA